MNSTMSKSMMKKQVFIEYDNIEPTTLASDIKPGCLIRFDDFTTLYNEEKPEWADTSITDKHAGLLPRKIIQPGSIGFLLDIELGKNGIGWYKVLVNQNELGFVYSNSFRPKKSEVPFKVISESSGSVQDFELLA